MDPVLAGVATAALNEGVKFLYEQAREILTAWRKRRRDHAEAPPKVVEPPNSVAVANPQPLPDPVDDQMEETLQELKDLAEEINVRGIPLDAPAARETVNSLRELLEVILRSPIRLEGEGDRRVDVGDVGVVVGRVAGRVAGVRANLDTLRGPVSIQGVDVEAQDVESGGDVSGVDLT